MEAIEGPRKPEDAAQRVDGCSRLRGGAVPAGTPCGGQGCGRGKGRWARWAGTTGPRRAVAKLSAAHLVLVTPCARPRKWQERWVIPSSRRVSPPLPTGDAMRCELWRWTSSACGDALMRSVMHAAVCAWGGASVGPRAGAGSGRGAASYQYIIYALPRLSAYDAILRSPRHEVWGGVSLHHPAR